MLVNYFIFFNSCFSINQATAKFDNKKINKHKIKSKSSLLIRGFYIYLTHNYCIESYNPTSLIKLITESSVNTPFKFLNKAKNYLYLPGVWSQWVSFFNVVSLFKKIKITFLYEGPKNLNFFIKALSWFSWSFSFLSWKFFFFNKGNLNTFKKPVCLINLNGFSKPKQFKKNIPVISIGNSCSFFNSWLFLYTSVYSKNFQIFFLSYFAQLIN